MLDREIARRAKADPSARRLMTIPGVGPITATAMVALAPAPETFRAGRDFAAWLGLTPLQNSTGGKQKLGADLQDGRAHPATAADHRRQRGGQAGAARAARRRARGWRRCWPASRAMLVTVALANKMARIVWALLAKGGIYRAPAAAA